MGEAVADMILANATIYTADPAMPFAEAMAVRAGRVLRVGGYYSVKVVFNSLLLFFSFSFWCVFRFRLQRVTAIFFF